MCLKCLMLGRLEQAVSVMDIACFHILKKSRLPDRNLLDYLKS